MKYDFAAFDFDGTLADTMPWFNSVLNTVAEKYGFRQIDAAEREQLRHRDPMAILKYLGIPLWKLPAIMTHMRELMRDIDPSVHLFDGMVDVLATLSRRPAAGGGQLEFGRERAARARAARDRAVRRLRMRYGPVRQGGQDRPPAAAAPDRPERFLLVGDEIRDIEAARKAGVRVASVGWGYNHVDALRERQPDELLLNVAELPAVLT